MTFYWAATIRSWTALRNRDDLVLLETISYEWDQREFNILSDIHMQYNS